MCDKGYKAIFHLDGCDVKNVGLGKTIVKKIRTICIGWTQREPMYGKNG